jgi:hypothetical protein
MSKIIVFLTFFTVLSGSIYGQLNPNARCYSYDAAGNRTNRYSCPGKTDVLDPTLAQQELSNLVVFPNPTQGVCQLKTEGLPPEANLQLTNLNGAVMWQRALGNGQFDMSVLPPGMYLLSLQYNGQQKTARLLKE